MHLLHHSKIRGRFRSVPMDELLQEAQRLASDGVKELVLVAQEVTLYGKDRTGKKNCLHCFGNCAGLQELNGSGFCTVTLRKLRMN